jgi:hypothetical protein
MEPFLYASMGLLSSAPIKAKAKLSIAPHLRLVADLVLFVVEHSFGPQGQEGVSPRLNASI